MSGGQHRVDEVTRTESRGLDRKNNPRIAAHRPPKETAGLRNAGVCAEGTKKESNTLDVADFVRDVANRVYHYVSRFEIGGAKRISRHLSGRNVLALLCDSSFCERDAIIAFTTPYRPGGRPYIRAPGYFARNRNIRIEWMIPPLWPWKVVSLPARGPRPTLKGEEALTLRLMEDVVLPRTALVAAPGWHFFWENSTDRLTTTQSKPPLEARSERVTRIALTSDVAFEVAKYRIDGGRVNYVLPNGQTGVVDVHDVNWRETSQLNAERGRAPILQANLRSY